MAKEITRRGFLKGLGVSGLVVIGADQGPRMAEFIPPSHSQIVFTKEQSQRLTQTDAACLVFGGATVRDPKDLVNAVSPALAPLGAVGGVLYAKDDLDVSSIAKGIRELNRSHGINKISCYLHSLGAQVFGKVLEEIHNEVAVQQIFLDCTPPSLEYLDQSTLANWFANAPYDGGAVLTALFNTANYHNPLKSGTAYPGLLWDQFTLLRDGERYLSVLSSVVNRDQSKVSLLTPQDSKKDVVVNAAAAEKRLREFFPGMNVCILGGNQAHGNPPANVQEYRRAIHLAINS